MDVEARQNRLEGRFRELEHRQYDFEKTFEALSAKLDLYIQKTDKAIEEQREEIRTFKAKHEKNMRDIYSKIDRLGGKIEDIGKEVRNIGRYVDALVITTIVGVATMAYSMNPTSKASNLDEEVNGYGR